MGVELTGARPSGQVRQSRRVDKRRTSHGARPLPHPKTAKKVYKNVADVSFRKGLCELCSCKSGSYLEPRKTFTHCRGSSDKMEKLEDLMMKLEGLTWYEVLVDLLKWGPDIFQKVSNIRLTNSQRKLINELRSQVPGFSKQLAALMESGEYRNEVEAMTSLYNAQTLEQAALALQEGMDGLQQAAEAVEASAGTLASGIETMALAAERAAAATGGTASCMAAAVRELHGVRIILGSLLDRLDIYACVGASFAARLLVELKATTVAVMKTEQHLADANSIAVSGSGGPDGFARHVYDFIRMRIDETEGQNGPEIYGAAATIAGRGKERAQQKREKQVQGDTETDQAPEHMFYVYHPDTNWWPAFHRLIRENPLPPSFCAKSDNLDRLCQIMLLVRAIMDAREAEVNGNRDGSGAEGGRRGVESGEGSNSAGVGPHRQPAGSNRRARPVFHLLVPAWRPFRLKRPLHFPDELHPLQIEGDSHGGGVPLLEIDLPAAPRDMVLRCVANNPTQYGGTVADAAATVTLGVTLGWGVNGACLAVSMGLGTLLLGPAMAPLIGVPLWFGTAVPAMSAADEVLEPSLHEAFIGQPPRILGSDRRMPIWQVRSRMCHE